MAIAKALLGFNDPGRSVTPTFLFRNRFYLQLSSHCSKMNKKSMWEVKKIQDFCPPDMEWWNRELTLKCKFKCYAKSMKDLLGVSPSKGNQGTTEVKRIFSLPRVVP